MVLAALTTSAALVVSGCAGAESPEPAPGGPTLADGPDAQPAPVFEGVHEAFVSRPDLAGFPAEITEGAAIDDLREGYIALTPMLTETAPEDQPLASLILDTSGEPVWINNREGLSPEHDAVNNLQFAELDGEPVLVWWEGAARAGWGHGDIVIADTSFQELHRLSAAGGAETVGADFHELHLTDNDTLLLAYYQPHPMDLSEFGGPVDGWVSSGLFQEYDLLTGEILFEWDSIDHVPVSATQWDFVERNANNEAIGSEGWPFDYFHINSINYDGEDTDTFLISARQTHAVYSIDRHTGDINWTLGGENSDFEMTGDSYFAWQHDAQRAEDGTIRILDNSSEPPIREESRVVWLELDEEAGTASVAEQVDPPTPRVAPNRANAQRLDSGELLVGWGGEPYLTKYNEQGETVIDVHHDPYVSYRAYFAGADWSAQPTDTPAVFADGESLFVSWNGATDVTQWRVSAGSDAEDAEFVTDQPRDGFETQIAQPEGDYIAVQALDEVGDVLATSFIAREG